MAVLTAERIFKSFDTIQALKGISFSIDKGEILGLTGPDGAGKTTLMRIMVSLLRPDSGSVVFQGRDIQKEPLFIRSHVGYMPERFSLYPDLTVEENLHFFGELFGVSKPEREIQIAKLYAFSRLNSFGNRPAGALSGGMKQKLALSCVLMHRPELLILDEPTTGVDPISRFEFWQILQVLAQEGTGILISTPSLEEAARCQRVGLLYDGRMLDLNTPHALVSAFPFQIFELVAEDLTAVYYQVRDRGLVHAVHLFGSSIHLTCDPGVSLDQLASDLKGLGIMPVSLKLILPKLEDVFLDYLVKEKRGT